MDSVVCDAGGKRSYRKMSALLNEHIRNVVGYQDDLQTASNRLGHTSTTTTQKYYRSNVSKIVPLSHWNQVYRTVTRL